MVQKNLDDYLTHLNENWRTIGNKVGLSQEWAVSKGIDNFHEMIFQPLGELKKEFIEVYENLVQYQNEYYERARLPDNTGELRERNTIFGKLVRNLTPGYEPKYDFSKVRRFTDPVMYEKGISAQLEQLVNGANGLTSGSQNRSTIEAFQESIPHYIECLKSLNEEICHELGRFYVAPMLDRVSKPSSRVTLSGVTAGGNISAHGQEGVEMKNVYAGGDINASSGNQNQ